MSPDPTALREAVRTSRAWACYDCGKCTSTCPITRAGGGCTPRRHVLGAHMGRGELDRASLYACLSCSQCETHCPADVRYTTLVQALREAAFDGGAEPECPHGGALQSVMRMMSRGAPQRRLEGLTPDLETSPEQGEVFFWTGCTMVYDAFFPEHHLDTFEGTKAGIRVLNRLGVVPVVSPDERCCGHDLLWNGDRASFERLARHNVALVQQSGASTLVVPCAECLRTWKVDYAPFLGAKPPKIQHFTEYVAERLPALRWAAGSDRTVTYQDPCRMGRHLGLYDAPRKVAAAVPGVRLAEMAHHGRSATCCAGGTWSNCDRFAKKVQVDRLREARATGAELLVTTCPKCRIHLACAMKDPRLGDEIRIETCDITQLVASALAQAPEDPMRTRGGPNP